MLGRTLSGFRLESVLFFLSEAFLQSLYEFLFPLP